MTAKKDLTTTTNLADFGFRELAIAGELLTQYANERKVPATFEDEGVHLMLNRNSGYVFLTNDEYQVLMLNSDNQLDMWHSCPICGHEGFIDGLEHNQDNDECQEWVKETKEMMEE